MIGYKGVELRNGILRSKYKDIFEINVPREFHKIYDGIGFSDNGYSFCGSIEDVLFHECYISPMVRRKNRDIRLFEIDTLDGDVIGESYHYKSSKIMLTREISQDEIIQYYSDNANARSMMLKRLKQVDFGEKIYEEYCSCDVKPYMLITDIFEIEDTYVHSCGRLLQSSRCQQKYATGLRVLGCEGCAMFNFADGPKECEQDYLYLLARRKLYMGENLKDIEEYSILIKKKCKEETAGLKLLSDFLHNPDNRVI